MNSRLASDLYQITKTVEGRMPLEWIPDFNVYVDEPTYAISGVTLEQLFIVVLKNLDYFNSSSREFKLEDLTTINVLKIGQTVYLY